MVTSKKCPIISFRRLYFWWDDFRKILKARYDKILVTIFNYNVKMRALKCELNEADKDKQYIRYFKIIIMLSSLASSHVIVY